MEKGGKKDTNYGVRQVCFGKMRSATVLFVKVSFAQIRQAWRGQLSSDGIRLFVEWPGSLEEARSVFGQSGRDRLTSGVITQVRLVMDDQSRNVKFRRGLKGWRRVDT